MKRSDSKLPRQDALAEGRALFDRIPPILQADWDLPSLENLRFGDHLYYGKLPHYAQLDSHVAGLLQDIARAHDITHLAPWQLSDKHMNGFLIHRMKFGESLWPLIDDVLLHYPEREGIGSILGIFGLPGAGKSKTTRALSAHGSGITVIDVDSARYALFGLRVCEVEGTDAQSPALFYTRGLFQIFDTFADLVSEALFRRGYRVLQVGAGVFPSAHRKLLFDHPLLNAAEMMKIEYPKDWHTLNVTSGEARARYPEFFAAVDMLHASCGSPQAKTHERAPSNFPPFSSFNDIPETKHRAPPQTLAYVLRNILLIAQRYSAQGNLEIINRDSNFDDLLGVERISC